MRFMIFAGAALLTLVLAGCVSPPVQAMSNARQAIQAAEAAGAQRYAPVELAEAKHWLDDAEFALGGDDYSHAQASAAKAVEAARMATSKARNAKVNAPASAPAPASGGGPLRSRVASGE
jgi:outer membrane lipoprotein SlyB